ncbi:NAD(P)H-dependent oxidoreductase [Candidatus Calescamantes bacterium]|nr:NAD(P)H-dependent oxidoreductase [Candidatus Calescamantes bacterium]
MSKVLVVYYSRTGNTEMMAREVAKGVEDEGVEVLLKKVEETTPEDFLDAEGIIIGSPTYFGLPSQKIVKLLDESVKYYGKLEGKVGGAFSTSGILGGGNETTVMGIIQMLLIHGMVIQGTTKGAHYGAVSIGKPGKGELEVARELGKRVASLVKKLFG